MSIVPWNLGNAIETDQALSIRVGLRRELLEHPTQVLFFWGLAVTDRFQLRQPMELKSSHFEILRLPSPAVEFSIRWSGIQKSYERIPNSVGGF